MSGPSQKALTEARHLDGSPDINTSSIFEPDRSAIRLPVSVITGFLGSGKTTLLNNLLRNAELSDTAVIVNEFGEIGLDHLLFERLDGETVLIAGGCVCCTVRSDMETTIRSLLARAESGAIPPFRRILIETTGLADPAPLVQTLLSNPLVCQFVRLDSVITTVDAVFGIRQLDEHPQSVKQVVMADRLVLTKTDLGTPDATDSLIARVQALNPAAPIVMSEQGKVDPAVLFDAGLYNSQSRSAELRPWLREEAYAQDHHDHHGHHGHFHETGIAATCLTHDRPLEWRLINSWLTALREVHGGSLLRAKGVLDIRGEPGPIVVHGVHHIFHSPTSLPRWPDEDRRSRLILITRSLDPAELRIAWSELVEAHEMEAAE
jgi:G3E family GTPase